MITEKIQPPQAQFGIQWCR